MHYLTKWAFALNRMAVVKRDPHYNELAIQLVKGESTSEAECSACAHQSTGMSCALLLYPLKWHIQHGIRTLTAIPKGRW